ncbi:MAG: hypothetical protein WAN74_05140 [Thermoplasmata archaeon]
MAAASSTGSASPVPMEHVGGGMRVAYLLLGILAFVFALALLVSFFWQGIFAAWVLYIFVVVSLLLMGIFDIVSGSSGGDPSQSGMRSLRVILGVFILIFAFVALFSVYFAFTVLWIFVGLGLFFQGIFLLAGIGAAGQLPQWQRGLGSALGVLDLILAFLVLLIPGIALILVALLIAIAGFAAGVTFFSIGLTGEKRPFEMPMGVPGFPPMGGPGGPGMPPSAPPK